MMERAILRRRMEWWLSWRREERQWTMSTVTVRRLGDPLFLLAMRTKKTLILYFSKFFK